MEATNITKTKQKRLWAWIKPDMHAKIKAHVASKGKQFLEEWVRDAILEKYFREIGQEFNG